MESVNLNIRLPQDLVVWLRQQADKETRSLSNYIRRALELHKECTDDDEG